MDQPSYYAVIPANVRYDKELMFWAKMMYWEITCLSNKTWICYASNKYFADQYWVSERQVQNWIKNLEDWWYIHRQVVYKEWSKEVELRYLTIADAVNKSSYGHDQKFMGGYEEKCADNNTSINIINNNISSKEDIDSQDEISPSLEDWIKHKSIEPSSAAKTAAQGKKPDSNYVLCDKLIKILKDTISVKALLKPMSVALTIDTWDNILLWATNYMAQLKDEKYKKWAINFLREEFWKKYLIKEKPALLKKYEIDIESASIRFYDKEEYIVDWVRERIQYRYLTPDQAVEFKQLYKDYYWYEYEGKLSVCMDKDARLKYFNY